MSTEAVQSQWMSTEVTETSSEAVQGRFMFLNNGWMDFSNSTCSTSVLVNKTKLQCDFGLIFVKIHRKQQNGRCRQISPYLKSLIQSCKCAYNAHMHINYNKMYCNIDQGCPKINLSHPVKKLVQPVSQNIKRPEMASTAEVGLRVIFWWCWGMLVTVY